MTPDYFSQQAYQQGFAAGYAAGMQASMTAPAPVEVEAKPKRRRTAYSRKYKAAFKRVAPKYKLKSGKWKAGGFKRAVKEAHKIAGGKKR